MESHLRILCWAVWWAMAFGKSPNFCPFGIPEVSPPGSCNPTGNNPRKLCGADEVCIEARCCVSPNCPVGEPIAGTDGSLRSCGVNKACPSGNVCSYQSNVVDNYCCEKDPNLSVCATEKEGVFLDGQGRWTVCDSDADCPATYTCNHPSGDVQGFCCRSIDPVVVKKIVTQSSLAFGGVPGRAIDGNPNPNYSRRSCTHTRQETNP